MQMRGGSLKPLPVNPHKRNTSHPRGGGGGGQGPPVQIALSRALSRRRRGRRGSQRRSGPARPGPWEPSVPTGWTRGPRDLRNFPSVSLPFPRHSLPGCWAPLVPWKKRGAGAGPHGRRPGTGTAPSISQDIQELPCSLLPSPLCGLGARSSPPLLPPHQSGNLG